MTILRIAAALAVALLGLAACDDDGASVRDLGGSASSGSGSGSGSASGVSSGSGTEASGTEPAECEEPDPADPALFIRLTEYRIELEEEKITSGPTRFRVANAGEEEHELLVVAENSLEHLPLNKKGSVKEGKLGPEQLITELEGIPAGEACALEVDLEPGTYALFCNIRERGDDGVVNHYLQGMRTRIKVS